MALSLLRQTLRGVWLFEAGTGEGAVSQDAPSFLVKLLATVGQSPGYDLTSRIQEFEYEDDVEAADKLTLTIDNSDLLLFDDERWRLGASLEVAWGYVGQMTPPRRCEVRSMRGFTLLRVEAVGRLIEMNQKKPDRPAFENMTRSEVVALIAKEYGYDTIIEDTKVKHASIVQPTTMTDAQFIRYLARREGYEFFVDKAKALHFHLPKYGQAPVKELVYYAGAGAGDILDVSLDYDAKHKDSEITVEGRDPLTKKTFKETASNKDTKRDSLAAVTEMAAISEISGERTTVRTVGTKNVVATSEATAGAAKRSADGQYLAKTRPELSLNVTVIGDRDLAAHRVVMVSNISRRFSGRYYIKTCVSKIGRGGFTQALKLERDGHNGFGSSKDVKNEGTLNKKDPTKKLTEKRVIHPESGEKSTVYTEE